MVKVNEREKTEVVLRTVEPPTAREYARRHYARPKRSLWWHLERDAPLAPLVTLLVLIPVLLLICAVCFR